MEGPTAIGVLCLPANALALAPLVIATLTPDDRELVILTAGHSRTAAVVVSGCVVPAETTCSALLFGLEGAATRFRENSYPTHTYNC